MANFLIRIELHGATQPVYDHLHQVMTSAGTKHKILGGDGVWYQLPTAMYSYEGSFTADSIRQWLQPLVAAVHTNYWLIVVDYNSVSWFLKKA